MKQFHKKDIGKIANRFKIRCSAISKIMTNSRKKDELSKTAQTYALNWIKEQPEFYDRRKEFSSKYTEKGNIMEDNSLDFISDFLGYGMLIKNEDFFENDFFTGTPDNIQEDHIIDAKCSWSFDTFPLFDDKCMIDYDWQGQGYMKLADKDYHLVIYTLMDTPEHLIDREARYYAFNNGYEEVDEAIYNKFVKQMTYGDVDPKNRIKIFRIERDNERIQAVENRVMEIRTFIYNTITNLIENR